MADDMNNTPTGDEGTEGLPEDLKRLLARAETQNEDGETVGYDPDAVEDDEEEDDGELEESFGTVSVDLPEDSREQHVKVIATDLAGNTVGASEEEEISVTISTNFLVRFVSNRPLFYGTIAAAAVILLGIILLIVKKKKQKQTEQTK